MTHLQAASEKYGWALRLADLGAIWQGGCIIRAKVLEQVEAAFSRDPSLANLLLDPAIAEEMSRRESGWRRLVIGAVQHGLPIPALSASLAYYDSLRTATLA